MNTKHKIIRVTTIPGSLKGLLQGQLNYMSKFFDVIAISSPGDALKEVEKMEGVKVYGVPIKRKPAPFSDLISIYRLYKIFKKEKPDIVHTHTPKAGMVGMIAAYLARVPVRMHTIAGLPLMTRKGLSKKILVLMEHVTYRFADHIYPNSHGLKNYIIALNIVNPSKVSVIGNGSSNGIDLDFFNPDLISDEHILQLRDKWNLKKNDIVFIYIGRIVKDKGINELVMAFKNILKKHENVKLLIVGRFEDELDPVDPGIKDFMLKSPDVVLTGYQKDIRPFLKLADIFIHPSHREGFPNVVLQACAFNKPAIVTDINGSNEIIQNNQNGIIVPVNNQDKLENAMVTLLLNETKRNEYILTGRKIVEEKYDRHFIWNKILHEYIEQLKKLP